MNSPRESSNEHRTAPGCVCGGAGTCPACLFEDRKALEDALAEYADHQTWRCGHLSYWDGEDCPCGLTATLKRLGWLGMARECYDIAVLHDNAYRESGAAP